MDVPARDWHGADQPTVARARPARPAAARRSSLGRPRRAPGGQLGARPRRAARRPRRRRRGDEGGQHGRVRPPGPGVPGHRRGDAGHRRRRHPLRHRHGLGHDERAAPADHPPRARPRPRVPPPPHARRADPARRRRRHVGVRLPRPGRAQGRRRRAAHRRHARRAHRDRLAPRPGHGRVPRRRRRRARAHAPPRRARGVRRDGCLRPPVRRHRGAADGGRGPALQRRRCARHVALRRGQLGDAAQLGAPPAGVHPHVVGGAGCGHRRLGAQPRRQRHARRQRGDLRSARRSCCSSTCC